MLGLTFYHSQRFHPLASHYIECRFHCSTAADILLSCCQGGAGPKSLCKPLPCPFHTPLLLSVYLHCIMGAAEAMPKPNLELGQHFIGK